MSLWTEPLRRWAEALQIDFQIEHTLHAKATGALQWRRQDGDWCLQLDAHTFVRFPHWDSTPALRDALTWTIANTSKSAHTAQTELDAEYETLTALSVEQMAQELTSLRASYLTGSTDWQYPGYLLVIHRMGTAQTTADDLDMGLAWSQVIPDVLAGTIGDAAYAMVGQDEDVLAYISLSQLEEVLADMPDGDEVLSPVRRLSSLARLLVTAITEDALLDVRVAVSKRVHSADELHAGVVSAILATRLSRFTGPNVAVFGESLLPFLVRMAPDEALHAFWQGLLERSGADMSVWPEDWIEIVQGVVAANLNVSEAARHLYVHRNTLLSKIDRLHQLTGYDVRHIGDAMILYLAALMKTQQQPAPKSR